MTRLLRLPHMGISINFIIDDILDEIISDFLLTYHNFLYNFDENESCLEFISCENYEVKIIGETVQTVRILACDVLTFIENYIYEHITVSSNTLLLHAGAIKYNNKGVILAGATMSGKSTLTSYLLNEGFEYITDDIVILNTNNVTFLPYPKTIMLREQSYNILREAKINLSVIGKTYGNKERWVVCPPFASTLNISANAIIYLNLTTRKENVIQIEPSVSRLAKILYYPQNIKQQLTLCNTITNKLKHYNMNFFNLSNARGMIEKVLDEV